MSAKKLLKNEVGISVILLKNGLKKVGLLIEGDFVKNFDFGRIALEIGYNFPAISKRIAHLSGQFPIRIPLVKFPRNLPSGIQLTLDKSVKTST